MKLPEIPSFEAKFEDLHIQIDKASALIYDVVGSKYAYTGGSDILQDITKHYYEDGRGLVGQLLLFFRNQGSHFDTIILLQILDISVRSYSDKDGASVFNKLIQYLFDWMTDYVKNNNVMDLKGTPFVMPPFHYSKYQFPIFEG